jgi:putative MATE family efflux protein
MNKRTKNSEMLANAPIGGLLCKFAIPSIIAMLVGALYNIVDQFFIGRKIGELGNAATNVAFPLSTLCLAIALLCGIGSASAFNLAMGSGDREKAAYYPANAVTILVGSGVVICVVVRLFLNKLLVLFGSPANVMPYAMDYTGITSFGFPFFLLATGGGHIIRSDGSPTYAMTSNLMGAVINTILDPILIFKFDMGIRGAAIATVAGQVFSACMVLWYIRHFKSMPLTKKHFKPQIDVVKRIVSLGMASGVNQLAITVVQIAMNNSLRHYGALSEYGESIPLACAGIISKINQICFSIVIGIGQGMQPIAGFNYGARNYKRAKKVILLAMTAGTMISLVAFAAFQIMPRQIISLFGKGDESYMLFAERYFRIFLFFTFLNGLQPICSSFFTSIGKPKKGIFLSLTRQVLFLLPLILVLPLFVGIDGILYAGPIADGVAAVICLYMMYRECKNLV